MPSKRTPSGLCLGFSVHSHSDRCAVVTVPQRLSVRLALGLRPLRQVLVAGASVRLPQPAAFLGVCSGRCVLASRGRHHCRAKYSTPRCSTSMPISFPSHFCRLIYWFGLCECAKYCRIWGCFPFSLKDCPRAARCTNTVRNLQAGSVPWLPVGFVMRLVDLFYSLLSILTQCRDFL